MELFEATGIFDRLIGIDMKQFYGFRYRFGILKNIREAGYQEVINCIYSRTFYLDSAACVSGAEFKYAHFGDCVNTPATIKSKCDRYYTELMPPLKQKFELVKNAEFIRWLGIQKVMELSVIPKGYPKKIDLPYSRYAVVFPGASKENRRWPLDRFYECSRYLFEKKGLTIILCGSKAEKKICDSIEQKLQGNTDVLNLSGRTSLRELAWLIAHSEFVLTNDTSAVHFAMALRIPNVCIIKSCDRGRFVPYNVDLLKEMDKKHCCVYDLEICRYAKENRDHCILSDKKLMPCIGAVSAEKVKRAIDQVFTAKEVKGNE